MNKNMKNAVESGEKRHTVLFLLPSLECFFRLPYCAKALEIHRNMHSRLQGWKPKDGMVVLMAHFLSTNHFIQTNSERSTEQPISWIQPSRH